MKFRQIAARLRIQMGPGRPDLVSERPRNAKTSVYLDIGPDGLSTTLVDIPDDFVRYVSPQAIAALPPEPPAAEPAAKGGKGG